MSRLPKVPLILVGLAWIIAATQPGSAQHGDVTRDELEELIEERNNALARLQALETAEASVSSDLVSLERDLVAAAMESQRQEEQAISAELELQSLRVEMTTKQQNLMESELALEGLMASLAVSGRHRPPAWLTQTQDANQAIRASLLMAHVAPVVKSRTGHLTEEISGLRRLEQAIGRELDRLAAAEAALDLKREEITHLTATKRAAYDSVHDDAEALRQRVALLAREADTIQTLLAALEVSAPRGPRLKPQLRLAAVSPRAGHRTDAPMPGLSRSPGQNIAGTISTLRAPATGQIMRAWGERMPGGTVSEGLTYVTRSQAQIVAPVSGKVEFSGPFRTYGQLLIISTSDGYHVLLSGMARAYVDVGQSVVQGEPVARMTQRVEPAPELYMEVRRSGRPVDPATWMERS